jgi:hypothetical protein
MVYLADWKSAIDLGRQMTEVKWQIDQHGPYVDDILELAKSDPDFEIETSENVFGSPKTLISLKNRKVDFSLLESEKLILNHVIQTTARKNFEEFIKLVYSTYPAITQEKYKKIDLESLAKEYKTINEIL